MVYMKKKIVEQIDFMLGFALTAREQCCPVSSAIQVLYSSTGWDVKN